MLSLAKVTPEMGAGYYNKEDYWSKEEGPAVPEFFGSMRPMLGLKEGFNSVSFQNLLEGKAPDGAILRPKTVSQFAKKGANSKESIHNLLLKKLTKEGVGKETAQLIVDRSLELLPTSSHLNKERAIIMKRELYDLLQDKENNKINKILDSHVESVSKTSDRAGLDLTFSAPKSVSLAVLIGGKMDILEAHKEAVKFSLDYLESNYIGNRERKNGKREFNKTNKMIGAMFHHGTSRAQDPQLHTHAVLINSTYSDKKGFTAIHNDEIYKHSVLLGTIYQKKLADLLMELGYEVSPRKKGTFELVGYSEEVLGYFSKRSEQIKEILKEEKLNNNSHDKRIAVLINRAAKEQVSSKELSNYWNEEFNKFNDKHPLKNDKPRRKLDAEWSFSVKHLSENHSLWKEKDLLLHTIQSNMNRSNLSELLQKYKTKSEVKFVTEGNDENNKDVGYTNLEIIKEEEGILSFVKEGKSSLEPICNEMDFDDYSSFKKFTKGQSEAFKLSLTSKDRVIGWNGVAGSGKSYALKDVADFAERNRYEVVGLSLDNSTSKLLNEDVGIKSKTIASFLLNREESKSNNKKLYIVDEAGKIDTATFHKFIKKIEKEESRVILVGDVRQIGAIGRGSPFSLLKQFGGMATAELKEHRRQKDPKLKSTVELASSINTAAKSPSSLGDNLIEKGTQKARIKKVINSYISLTKEEREKTIILTDLNSDRENLISSLRVEQKNRKEIGKDNFFIKTLVKSGLSQEQIKKYWSYEVGDIVVPYSSDNKAIKNNNQYEVVGINRKTGKLKLKHGDYYTTINPQKDSNLRVYKVKEIPISSNEKIQMTSNNNGFKNREELRIKSVKNEKIYFHGTDKCLDLSKGAQFFDYADVKSTYSTQGKTCDRVIMLANSSISSETWYVGISRAQNEAIVVTDSISKLEDRVCKRSLKQNVLDNSKNRNIFTPKKTRNNGLFNEL